MEPVPLVARMAFAYAGRSLSIGDTFEASERDASILTLLGRASAREESERVIVPKRRYQRRDLKAEA